MKRPLQLIGDALAGDERDAQYLGDPPSAIDPSTVSRLRRQLDKTRQMNSRLLIAPLVAITLVLVLALYLVVLHRNDPNTMAKALTGASISFPLIILWLRNLWRDKWVLDLLLAGAEAMTPDEFASLAARIYFAHQKTQGGSAWLPTHPEPAKD